MNGWTVRRRLVVAAAAVTAGGAVLLALAAFWLLAASLRRDAASTLDTRMQAALAEVQVVDGGLSIVEGTVDGPLDANVWIYSGGTAIEAPPASASVQQAADSLKGVTERTQLEVTGSEVVLLAEPVRPAGKPDAAPVGTVVVSVATSPYRTAAVTAAVWIGGALAVVLVGVVLLSVLLVRAALRPVASMTEQAARWSETDLTGRFAAGPPRDELTALAATLDSLLDRLASTVAYDRRLTAELAHELRTPLAVLRSEVEITERHPPEDMHDFVVAVGEQTQRMEAIVSTLMSAAEHELDPHAATCDLDDAVATAVAQNQGGSAAITLTPSDAQHLVVATDHALVVQILKPLLENAVRHAHAHVSVVVTADAHRAHVCVADDGPGLPADVDPDELFLPGVRVARDGEPGAGLGLSLARRLARSVSGDVTTTPSSGGARFDVALPRALPPS